MRFRTAFDEVRYNCDCNTGDVSLTKQSFRDEVDVNNIVGKFFRSGELPPGGSEPQFADVSEGFDFQSMRNLVAQANSSFESLPFEVREFCGHSQERFSEFAGSIEAGDQASISAARALGLLPDAPILAPLVPPMAPQVHPGPILGPTFPPPG